MYCKNNRLAVDALLVVRVIYGKAGAYDIDRSLQTGITEC